MVASNEISDRTLRSRRILLAKADRGCAAKDRILETIPPPRIYLVVPRYGVAADALTYLNKSLDDRRVDARRSAFSPVCPRRRTVQPYVPARRQRPRRDEVMGAWSRDGAATQDELAQVGRSARTSPSPGSEEVKRLFCRGRSGARVHRPLWTEKVLTGRGYQVRKRPRRALQAASTMRCAPGDRI